MANIFMHHIKYKVLLHFNSNLKVFRYVDNKLSFLGNVKIRYDKQRTSVLRKPSFTVKHFIY